MKHLKLVLIIFLTTSVGLGDKLYLKNGQVLEGKYEGMVHGRPLFIQEGTDYPIGFNPSDLVKITDDMGNVIVTGEEVVAHLQQKQELERNTFDMLKRTVCILIGCYGLLLLSVLLNCSLIG